jgi:hypothetical protein
MGKKPLKNLESPTSNKNKVYFKSNRSKNKTNTNKYVFYRTKTNKHDTIETKNP